MRRVFAPNPTHHVLIPINGSVRRLRPSSRNPFICTITHATHASPFSPIHRYWLRRIHRFGRWFADRLWQKCTQRFSARTVKPYGQLQRHRPANASFLRCASGRDCHARAKTHLLFGHGFAHRGHRGDQRHV